MMGLLVLWSTDMSVLSPKQRSILLANCNVKDVFEKRVYYLPAFNIKAVHEYKNGFSPKSIFLKAGIPIDYFIDSYCRNCLKKWIKKFEEEGEEGLREDRRGLAKTGKTGRPKKERPEELTYDELLVLVEIQKEALEEVKKQNALARKKKL